MSLLSDVVLQWIWFWASVHLGQCVNCVLCRVYVSYSFVLLSFFCCFIILQEIIEFPVLKVNGITFEIESQFHQYVQPDVNKELTDFCTEVNSSDIWTSTMHDTIRWWYDCVLKTSSRGVSLYSLYTQHSCCLIGSVGAWRNRLSCYVFIC